MKQWLLVLTLENTGLMVFDFDTKNEAIKQHRIFVMDDVEAGPIQKMAIGLNMNWVCPVCDGGPGNYCNCKCE